jgi:cyclic beta-1,2-glucan synthetase
VEPYVVAADVYAASQHLGRGGWTWYTGSAGWMYRLVLESLLGLRLEGSQLRFAPCLPAHWPGLRIHYRYRSATYHIAMTQRRVSQGETPVVAVTVDGAAQPHACVPLLDDGREHHVDLVVTVA